MGDRVTVLFTNDAGELSPGVYMHWAGEHAPDMIRNYQHVMRRGDIGYAAARFCGECHKALGGRNLGLGLVDAPATADSFAIDWDEYSPGDAGVYVVNVNTGEVAHYSGYGEAFTLDPAKFSQD